MVNEALGNARNKKDDEFYTQLTDIEKELEHYADAFNGMKVFCNCDDPYESNFFKYFAMNFNRLGLRQLTAMCFKSSPIVGKQLTLDQLEFKKGSEAYKIVIREVKDFNGDGATDLADVEWLIKNDKNVLTKLKGDGDFRSPESIECLKECDIVVTNPPFSLFREYLDQLMEYGKKFLIIGNQNNVTYKQTFNLIKDDRIWFGYHVGDMAFKVPEYYEPRETRFWIDKSGQKWRSLGTICWYTNLDTTKRHEEMILFRNYSPEDYPKYDNYDIIEVGRLVDIPCDYDGVMGVPITFLDKYNPDQFEILGIANSARWIGMECYTIINGVKKYNRILIRKRVKA